MEVSEVEKGIPVPPKQSRARTFPSMWPVIKQLEVGDSVVITEKEITLERARTYALNAARQYKYKIATRKLDRDSLRIWRIA